MKSLRFIILFSLVILFLCTRLVGIDWALPYPFHPDERNMADAVLRLTCSSAPLKDCMEPGFYAYGQLPLYFGWLMAHISRAVTGVQSTMLSYADAALGLRGMSFIWMTLTCLLMVWYVYTLVHRDRSKDSQSRIFLILSGLLIVSQPYAIIFSHYGTTESMLMFFYMLLIYMLSFQTVLKPAHSVIAGLIVGMSAGIKLTGLFYGLLPVLVILRHLKEQYSLKKRVQMGLLYACVGLVGACIGYVVASPHNILHYKDFVQSISYELRVGDGSLPVFYTQQFAHAIPGVFQSIHVFPYLLGTGIFIIALFSVALLSNGKHHYLVLKLSLLFAVMSLATYIKWGRAMAPVLPAFTLLALCGMWEVWKKIHIRWLRVVLMVGIVFFAGLRGIAQLSIYARDDVRLTASDWIHAHIPQDSTLMTEFGNGLTLPILGTGKNTYDIREINMYEVDTNDATKASFEQAVHDAEYIVIPSRRVFANYTCAWPDTGSSLRVTGYFPTRCTHLKADFPTLHAFYSNLFNPSKYKLVQEFTSYPHVTLFGRKLYEIKDEHVEEALTVFDHPVVRIYQRK